MSFEQRLTEMGIEIPHLVTPAANYSPGVVRAGLLFVSGQTPRVGNEMAVKGSVGLDVSLEEARGAARICATRLLAVARNTLGTLDKVSGVAELTVYVRSTGDFDDPSSVADAASDLLMSVFGAAGRHARSAVCVPQLPRGAAVEVSCIFELHSTTAL